MIPDYCSALIALSILVLVAWRAKVLVCRFCADFWHAFTGISVECDPDDDEQEDMEDCEDEQ